MCSALWFLFSSFPVCLFSLSYILWDDSACFCARHHPSLLLYLLSTCFLPSRLILWTTSARLLFPVGCNPERAPVGSQKCGEEWREPLHFFGGHILWNSLRLAVPPHGKSPALFKAAAHLFPVSLPLYSLGLGKGHFHCGCSRFQHSLVIPLSSTYTFIFILFEGKHTLNFLECNICILLGTFLIAWLNKKNTGLWGQGPKLAVFLATICQGTFPVTASVSPHIVKWNFGLCGLKGTVSSQQLFCLQ